MQYIYHRRPPDMVGAILYPLNQLKTLYPPIYERQVAKYVGREQLLSLVIPKLNCLWNDVVQCAPIHPHLLYRELVSRNIPINPNSEFFKIPLTVIAAIPTVIYHKTGKSNISLPIPDEDIAWFDYQNYQELTEVPTDTLQWYDHLATTGRHFAIYSGVPHVFIHGTLDVSQVELCRWDLPPS